MKNISNLEKKMPETMFFYLFLPKKSCYEKCLDVIRLLRPHFFFCFVIIYFFGLNCRLRPAANPALLLMENVICVTVP